MRSLSTLLTALALVTAAGTLLATRSWRTAIRVLLDLLTAAGLLRLAGDQTWSDLASAAVIVVLRHLVSAVLLGSGPGAPGPAADRGPPSSGWDARRRAAQGRERASPHARPD